MTDQKIKTKKAILGELESISSLLQINEIESSEIDSADEEPPLLTAMADDEIEFSDDFADSPLLTDALNSVIDAIEGRAYEDDIPTLADSIVMPDDLQAKSGHEELFAGNYDLDTNESSGSEAHDEDDIVSRALKSKLPGAKPIVEVAPIVEANPIVKTKERQNSNDELPITTVTSKTSSSETPSSKAIDEDFSLPELIVDEQYQEEYEEITTKVISSPTTNEVLASEGVNENAENARNFDLEANTALIDDIPSFGDVEALSTNQDDLKNAITKNLPQEADDNLKAQINTETLNAEQIKSLHAKTMDIDVLGKTEHQPSLFDKDVTPVLSASSKSETTKRSSKKNTADKKQNKTPRGPIIAGDSKKIINANNPFLPKHIRDRLHTNRTLQQEIDDSPYMQTANNTLPSDPLLGTGQAGNNGADELLVDELVHSYIAKIEPELRDKIRNLIKQEKQTSDK